MKGTNGSFEPTKSACKHVMSIIKRYSGGYDKTEVENAVFTILGNLVDEVRETTDCIKISQEKRDA